MKKTQSFPREKGLYQKKTKNGVRWVLKGVKEIDGKQVEKYVTVHVPKNPTPAQFAEAVAVAKAELNDWVNPPKDIEFYIDQYATKRSLSQGSLYQYHHALKPFNLNEENDAAQVAEILERDIKDSSKKRMIGIVNTFYKYLVQMGVVKKNPAAGIRIGRWARRTRIPTDKETNDFLLYTDTNGNSADSLFFRLVVLTGARVSTIEALRCCDLSNENRISYYNVKTRKRYGTEIAVNDPVVIDLWHELSEGRKPTDLLFGDGEEAERTKRRLQCRMQRFFTDRDENGERLSPHSWRHSFGCKLLNQGVPLTTIASAMDHQSASVTYQYYARPDQDAVDEALLNAELLPDDDYGFDVDETEMKEEVKPTPPKQKSRTLRRL